MALLGESGHPATLDKSKLAAENRRAIMTMPDWRLAYELIPEIAAVYALRSLGEPSNLQYTLPDQNGDYQAFELRDHPVYAPVIALLERQIFHGEALRDLAGSSAAIDAIGKMLNTGGKLDDCAFCCAPLGMVINHGILEIKAGFEID